MSRVISSSADLVMPTSFRHMPKSQRRSAKALTMVMNDVAVPELLAEINGVKPAKKTTLSTHGVEGLDD
jgi:hypothetical protein